VSRAPDWHLTWSAGKDMSKVDLNDLPRWSQWPARLLGLAPWTIPSRTIEKVDQEYDRDKYAQCLDYFTSAGENITPEEVKQFEFGLGPADRVCISIGNDLHEVSLSEARARYYQLFLDTMRTEVEKCKTVIELGAGYGFNLWMLQQHFGNCRFWGGEYSRNAIQLAARLYQNNPKITVEYFNFYDPSTYAVLAEAERPIVVFTAHAIEQLPCSSLVFDTLFRYHENIQAVFHFEPVYQLHDETLLGLMRRRYAEVNDYNRDLLCELQSRSCIRVVRLQADVLGLNPLNPTSIIQWVFAQCYPAANACGPQLIL